MGMYVDSDFPPSDVSLWGKGSRRCFEQLEWLRPEDFSQSKLFDGSLSEPKPRGISNVTQGLLSDCYLVAAIALLARQPSLLSRILVAYKPEDGWCTVKLFLNGQWEEVTVDTFLPCCDKRPAFAHHCDGAELYACYLEKACAKAYGSYSALIGGHIDEALMDLTGLAVEEINLSRGINLPSIAQHWEKGDLLACAWIAKGTGTVRLHHHIKPNHVYVVVDVLIEKNCDEEPVAFTLKMLDLATRCGDPGMQRTFWVAGKDIQHSFNRLSVCHTSTSQLDGACQEACHRIQITNSNAGGCLNFPTFHKNSMFRISLTSKDPIQDPIPSLAIIVSQQDARHLTNGHEISYPQLGVAVLCQDVVKGVEVKGVENDSSCTRNRRTILKQTAFSSKRDVSVILQLEQISTNKEYRVVPSFYFPGDVGMGELHVRFIVSSSLVVEKLTSNIRTHRIFDGFHSQKIDLPATSGLVATSIPCNACKVQLTDMKASLFKVTSEATAIPLTVVLTQRPETSLCWWMQNPIHLALHRCFKTFDSDHDDFLTWKEVDTLCDELFLRLLQEERKKKPTLFARRELTTLVSFGHFLSLVLRQGFSQNDLQKAANLIVPLTDQHPSVGDTRNAFVGVAAVDPYVEDLKDTCVSPEKLGASMANGSEMPAMSDVNVWSSSFLVQQSEFYLCPLLRNVEDISLQLQVLSSLDDLVVEQLEVQQLQKRRAVASTMSQVQSHLAIQHVVDVVLPHHLSYISPLKPGCCGRGSWVKSRKSS